MRRLVIKQRNIPVILLLTGMLCIVGILILPAKSQTTYIENLKVRSEDQSILVSWTIPSVRFGNSIEVEMQSPNGTFIHELCPWESSYKYTQGEHGVLYDICVKVKDSAGKVIEEQNAQSLFVDWGVFSDIPILSIDTYSGNDPTATYLRNPGELADGKGVLGATIIDNEPVFANIKMMKRGDEIYSSTVEISLRGNTSAFSEKKPYKLKFTKAVDLLNRGDKKYIDREWVLLKDDKLLTLETGTIVSELCGLEWQPQFMPVNVILNGDWKGCYYLCESVKKAEGRVAIEDNGFLIELDPYWWSGDKEYFKTPNLPFFMGYTYAYYSLGDSDMKNRIKEYMCDYEFALLDKKAFLTDYIDINTFSGWLLTHDILGSYDYAGSNIFMYCENIDSENQASRKIKLGPAWDFDGSFICAQTWAPIHYNEAFEGTNIGALQYHNFFFSDSLFENPAFKMAYKNKWNVLSNNINETIKAYLQDYLERYIDLQESWNLDAFRWQEEQKSVKDAMEFVNYYFNNRTEWLNQNVPGL